MVILINIAVEQTFIRPEQVALIAKPFFGKDPLRTIFALLPNQDFLNSREVCLLWFEASNLKNAWSNRVFNLTIGSNLGFTPLHARFFAPPDWEEGHWRKVRQKIAPQCLDVLQLAKGGDAIAQAELGRWYLKGQVDQIPNFNKGAEWLQTAANQKNADAEFLLGVCYEHGLGVAQSQSNAVRLYRLAVKQGHAQAQFELALYYLRSKGVQKNGGRALRLMRLAADQGHAGAKDKVAKLYTIQKFGNIMLRLTAKLFKIKQKLCR